MLIHMFERRVVQLFLDPGTQEASIITAANQDRLEYHDPKNPQVALCPRIKTWFSCPCGLYPELQVPLIQSHPPSHESVAPLSIKSISDLRQLLVD
jgi:hypothetical protein